MRKIYFVLVIALMAFSSFPTNFFNSTPTAPPFTQNWANTTLITLADDWSGVPGIVGFRGDDITTTTGVDPQTLLGEGTITIDINANQTNPSGSTTGGVSEFDALADPVVALQGSGTADAPNIVIYLNTTGFTSINVAYNIRDIDGSADNSTQAVALQYRVGNTGNFTNIPAGFVADATSGPSLATLVTPVSAALPAACDNQAEVQVRIITSNAVGNDEWVGIDDINITGTSGGGPLLSASPLTSFGNVCTNVIAGPNSFTITGSNLTTADVTVAALDGFTYSTTSGGTYTPTLTLTQPGGAFSQEVFVRFTPIAVQSYSDDINVGGGGASGITVSAVGSGVNTAPTVTAGAATGITGTTANVAGTITANGCTAVSAYGIEYSTTNGFTPGTGTQVAGGALTGNDYTSNLTGLTAATTYYYVAYATNAGGTSYSTQGSFTSLLPEPTNHATAFACGTTTASTIPLTWADATGGTVPTGYLIKWSAVSFAAITDPVDGTPESNGAGILNVVAGTQAGTATGLLPSATYFFKIFPYTNSGSIIDYKIDGTVPQTSCATLAGPIAAWDFTGNNTATATFTATTFDANLVSASGANNITRGAGAAASAATNSFRTTGFQNNGISTANTDYFQVTLTSQPGFELSLSAINANMAGTASFAVSPGVSSQFAYSLDGTNFTLIGSPAITIGSPAVLPAVDLTGISALQNVAAGTTVTLRYYASGQTTTGGWGFISSSPGVNGLAIGGTLAVSSAPSLAVTPGSLSFGQQAVGSNSTSQSVDLSGVNLTGAPGNITVTAPSTDFQVSNDNSTWGGGTTIAYSAATLAATPVYVRFTPQSAGAKSGNVTFSGGGDLTPPTLAVSGTGTITYYSKAAGNLTDVGTWGPNTDGTGTSPANFTSDAQIFTVANRTTTTLNADWTVSGSGSKVVVGNGTNAEELVIPPGFALTGTVDVVNQGTLQLQNTTLPTFATLATGSTLNFAQSGTFVIPAGTYHHLTLTSGTKTLSSGATTINGNFTVDGVTGFNGAGSPFSTVNLAGDFSLLNGAAFEPNPTGDGNRMTLVLTGSVNQTLSGGDFQLFRLQTPATPLTSLNINLSSANLLLGNAAGGGLNLLQATHTVPLNANTLTIRGSGIFSGTNVGTITTNGSSNLVIDKTSGSGAIGSIGFTFSGGGLNNLTVNSAGAGNNNLTILTNLQVNNLTLTSGRIVIPAGNQVEVLTSLSGTGFGASKHIVTSVNTTTGAKGSLRVDGIAGAASFTFPVGDGTNYLPVTVTPSSGNDFIVTTFSGITGNGEPNGTPFTAAQKDDVVDAVWDVSRFSATGDATLTTSWPASLEGASFAALADNQIGIAHNSGVWGTVAGTGDNTANTATRSAISTFSPFGVGQVGQVLPVNFGTVKATQQSAGIKVEWSNLTELEVISYSVERSADGRSFTAIGQADARLNNGGRADYSFMDMNPFSGVNFYRIRSLETGGKTKYSIIVRVDTRGDITQLVLYPNPVTGGQLSYQAVNLVKGQYTIRIFNTMGQQVYTQALNHQGGSVSEAITLPAVKAGVYSLQLSSADNTFVKTFVVQ